MAKAKPKTERLPAMITANDAITLLGVARKTFFDRVDAGIYLVARVRAGDPPSEGMLFRPEELVAAEHVRRHRESLGLPNP